MGDTYLFIKLNPGVDFVLYRQCMFMIPRNTRLQKQCSEPSDSDKGGGGTGLYSMFPKPADDAACTEPISPVSTGSRYAPDLNKQRESE